MVVRRRRPQRLTWVPVRQIFHLCYHTMYRQKNRSICLMDLLDGSTWNNVIHYSLQLLADAGKQTCCLMFRNYDGRETTHRQPHIQRD
jgi:hypothetical protein